MPQTIGEKLVKPGERSQDLQLYTLLLNSYKFEI